LEVVDVGNLGSVTTGVVNRVTLVLLVNLVLVHRRSGHGSTIRRRMHLLGVHWRVHAVRRGHVKVRRGHVKVRLGCICRRRHHAAGGRHVRGWATSRRRHHSTGRGHLLRRKVD